MRHDDAECLMLLLCTLPHLLFYLSLVLYQPRFFSQVFKLKAQPTSPHPFRIDSQKSIITPSARIEQIDHFEAEQHALLNHIYSFSLRLF
jgi:hypothetical protein